MGRLGGPTGDEVKKQVAGESIHLASIARAKVRKERNRQNGNDLSLPNVGHQGSQVANQTRRRQAATSPAHGGSSATFALVDRVSEPPDEWRGPDARVQRASES